MVEVAVVLAVIVVAMMVTVFAAAVNVVSCVAGLGSLLPVFELSAAARGCLALVVASWVLPNAGLMRVISALLLSKR